MGIKSWLYWEVVFSSGGSIVIKELILGLKDFQGKLNHPPSVVKPTWKRLGEYNKNMSTPLCPLWHVVQSTCNLYLKLVLETCLIWAYFHWFSLSLILSVSSQQWIQYLKGCPKRKPQSSPFEKTNYLLCLPSFRSVFIFIHPPRPRHHAPGPGFHPPHNRRPPHLCFPPHCPSARPASRPLPPCPATPPRPPTPPPRHFFLSSLASILCPVSAFLLLSSRSIAPFRPIESTSTTVKCTMCTEHSTVQCVLHCTLCFVCTLCTLCTLSDYFPSLQFNNVHTAHSALHKRSSLKSSLWHNIALCSALCIVHCAVQCGRELHCREWAAWTIELFICRLPNQNISRCTVDFSPLCRTKGICICNYSSASQPKHITIHCGHLLLYIKNTLWHMATV